MQLQITIKATRPTFHLTLKDFRIVLTIASTSRPRTSIYERINMYICTSSPRSIEPNMYLGKFDRAKCLGYTEDRNYVMEILHNAVCVHKEVARIGQEFVDMMMVIGQAH